MSHQNIPAKLSSIVEKFRRRSKYGSIVMHIESVDRSFAWSHGIGAESSVSSQTIGTASPFFIASATKLFVTAVVLQLTRENRLDLDQPIVDVVTRANLVGLHRLNGRDHTKSITARQLLSHTSGLANYLEDRASDDTRLLHNVLKLNGDRRWSRTDIYGWHRTKFDAVFEPGTERAHYSDSNFHLLAELVEHIEGAEFDAVFRKRIAAPLGLTGTSMFGTTWAPKYGDVATMFTGGLPANIPLAMASVREDGGMVSTTQDCLTFLRSLVDESLVGHNPFVDQTWRRVFFPLEYGLGVMRINIPRFMSPFGKPPVLYGHGGASGTVLFYDPVSSLMIAGTVNQIERRNKPYQLMLRLIQAARNG